MTRPAQVIDGRARVAYVTFGWALLTGVVHALWPVAYFFWPAAGRATLGADFFERAFSRPAFMAYDIIVATLFLAAALLAFGVARPADAGLPRWLLVSGVWTAAVLLFLPGAAGVVRDLLIVLNIIQGTPSPLMFYDLWFLLGGSLFGATAMRLRQRT